MTALPQIHPTVTRPLLAALVAAFAGVSPSQAALQTYTSDANTLHLYTFDEAAGGSVTANSGSIGGNALAVRENNTTTGTNTSVLSTTMLGQTGFFGFGNAVSIAKVGTAANPQNNEGVGYDFSANGAYSQGSGTTTAAQDRITNYSTYFDTGSYTLEAMINIPSTANTPSGQRSIISFESNINASRSMYLRIDGGNLQLGNAGSFRSIAIPTTGPDAFVADAWFHVAVSHNPDSGGSTQFYWTRVDASRSIAASLGAAFTGAQVPASQTGSPNLALGTDSRQAFTESLGGLLDNVRISDVARTADQFIFTAIPEPSSFAALAGLGTIGFVASRRRRSVC